MNFGSLARLVVVAIMTNYVPATAKQIGPTDERVVVEDEQALTDKFHVPLKFAKQVFSSMGSLRCPYGRASAGLVTSAGESGTTSTLAVNSHMFVNITPTGDKKTRICKPYRKSEYLQCQFESFDGRRVDIDASDPRIATAINDFLPGCELPSTLKPKADLLLLSLAKSVPGAAPFLGGAGHIVPARTPLLVISAWQADVAEKLHLDNDNIRPIVQTCTVIGGAPGAYVTDCDLDQGGSGGLHFDISDPEHPRLVGANTSIFHDLPNGSAFDMKRMLSLAAAIDSAFLLRNGLKPYSVAVSPTPKKQKPVSPTTPASSWAPEKQQPDSPTRRVLTSWIEFGMIFENMSDTLRAKYALSPAATGVVVIKVEHHGPADMLGVKVGDTIISGIERPIANVTDVSLLIDAAKKIGKNNVVLLVTRGGAEEGQRYLVLPMN
jgi:hypothetical protein